MNWDFEYAIQDYRHSEPLLIFHFSNTSSGDSGGKTPEESNNSYDDVANERPSTLLALNHEVYGKLVIQ